MAEEKTLHTLVLSCSVLPQVYSQAKFHEAFIESVNLCVSTSERSLPVLLNMKDNAKPSSYFFIINANVITLKYMWDAWEWTKSIPNLPFHLF